MNEYNLLLNQGGKIDFNPPDTVREILQNVRTILTTYKYSVPLDRDLGIAANFLDESQPRAIALLSSEMANALAEYEPRAKLREVKFLGNQDGLLAPDIRIRLII